MKRAGAHDKAVACLHKAVTDDPEWVNNVVNWLVLVMAHQRLGHTRESSQWLQEADSPVPGTDKDKPE